MNKVALIYKNEQSDDMMVLIDCSDDSVMYNNDINWKAEKPSSPTKDAIDRIWDRIQNKITTYRNEEITEVLAKKINRQLVESGCCYGKGRIFIKI